MAAFCGVFVPPSGKAVLRLAGTDFPEPLTGWFAYTVSVPPARHLARGSPPNPLNLALRHEIQMLLPGA